MATARKTTPTAPLGVRAQSAQATRDKILKAATRVFAQYGYQGGSVEKISRAAKSVDRMIYYYFGSKEGLFIEVIEGIYRQMNEAETRLRLNTDDPVGALCQVIDFVLGITASTPSSSPCSTPKTCCMAATSNNRPGRRSTLPLRLP